MIVSEGVQGGSKSERKVATKNEKKKQIINNNNNVNPSVVFKTVPEPPASVPHNNGRKFIDPQGKEFGAGGAGVAEVIDIIKRNFNGPYLSWSKIPQPIKDSWFKELKTKYWWYPESHDWVRWSFELCGCIEVKRSLWEARVNEQRPEWIDKSIWKQMCKHWEAKKKSKTNNNIQLNNKKTPFAASTSGTKDNKIKQEKLDQPIQSSSNKDKREKEIHHRIPPEVKEAMEIIMEEQEIVKGLIESMNQIWIQHVENLEHVGPTFQLLPPPVNNSPEADFRRPPPGQFRHPNVSTFAGTTLPCGHQMKGNGGYNWKKDYY